MHIQHISGMYLAYQGGTCLSLDTVLQFCCKKLCPKIVKTQNNWNYLQNVISFLLLYIFFIKKQTFARNYFWPIRSHFLSMQPLNPKGGNLKQNLNQNVFYYYQLPRYFRLRTICTRVHPEERFSEKTTELIYIAQWMWEADEKEKKEREEAQRRHPIYCHPHDTWCQRFWYKSYVSFTFFQYNQMFNLRSNCI